MKLRQLGNFLDLLFFFQRVNQCLRDACHDSNLDKCMNFIDCGHGNDFGEFQKNPTWKQWKSNENATACFGQGGFSYGIYEQAVNLTTKRSVATRYIYSLFWGFQVSMRYNSVINFHC